MIDEKDILYWINDFTYCLIDSEVICIYDNSSALNRGPFGTHLPGHPYQLLELKIGQEYRLKRWGRETHDKDTISLSLNDGVPELIFRIDKDDPDTFGKIDKRFVTVEKWMELRNDKIENIILNQ